MEVVNIHVVVARTYSMASIAYDTAEREIGWFANAFLANQFISQCDNTPSSDSGWAGSYVSGYGYGYFRIIEKPALLIDGKYYKLEEMEVSK